LHKFYSKFSPILLFTSFLILSSCGAALQGGALNGSNPSLGQEQANVDSDKGGNPTGLDQDHPSEDGVTTFSTTNGGPGGSAIPIYRGSPAVGPGALGNPMTNGVTNGVVDDPANAAGTGSGPGVTTNCIGPGCNNYGPISSNGGDKTEGGDPGIGEDTKSAPIELEKIELHRSKTPQIEGFFGNNKDGILGVVPHHDPVPYFQGVENNRDISNSLDR